MSVTFTAQLGSIVGFTIACCREAALIAPRYGDYDDAADALVQLRALEDTSGQRRAVLPGCAWPEVCPDSFLTILPHEEHEAPSVNVTDSNAALLLDALGYRVPADDVIAGTATADEFTGRVLTALALAPADAGAPWHEPTPRFVECGRRPGYLQRRLRELQDLATWCAQHGREVQWA
ncbi:hypothetical protein ACIA5G_50955 [Amycolatopsis sp. NPDC051758]|uniref:hypothetical protein n=1 Tax=Amycolatopsis sp. NPDC051758 TaxID=3363935 RepID=UPI0037B65EF0